LCLAHMERERWKEGCEKCWMRILAVRMEFGKHILVVDPRVKEFDWSTLEIPQKEIQKFPITDKHDNIFDGW